MAPVRGYQDAMQRAATATARPRSTRPPRQAILDDLERYAQAGYPAIGRLRRLTDLCGVITALFHTGP